jgi:hypothetical protein
LATDDDETRAGRRPRSRLSRVSNVSSLIVVCFQQEPWSFTDADWSRDLEHEETTGLDTVLPDDNLLDPAQRGTSDFYNYMRLRSKEKQSRVLNFDDDLVTGVRKRDVMAEAFYHVLGKLNPVVLTTSNMPVLATRGSIKVNQEKPYDAIRIGVRVNDN